MSANKLFCTFSSDEQLEGTIVLIKSSYDILYGKIYVLHSEQTNEYICTYNIDPYNTSGTLLPNTILTHRKKEYNTIYSINALNLLIKSLNNNILDHKFQINWIDYSNSILLSQNNAFKKLPTTLYKIISL